MNASVSYQVVVDDDDSLPRPMGFLANATAETKRVVRLAWPVTASEVLTYMAYLLTTAQVGHIGSHELSALTLGRSVFHLTGLSL